MVFYARLAPGLERLVQFQFHGLADGCRCFGAVAIERHRKMIFRSQSRSPRLDCFGYGLAHFEEYLVRAVRAADQHGRERIENVQTLRALV